VRLSDPFPYGFTVTHAATYCDSHQRSHRKYMEHACITKLFANVPQPLRHRILSCVGIKARQLDELHVHAEAVEQYMWFGGSPFTLHSIRHTSPFTGAYHDAVEDSSPFTLHSIRHTSPFTGAYEVPAKTAHPSVCWPEPTRNICLCFRLVGLEHPSLTIECEVESAPGSVGSFNPTAPGRLPHSPC